MLLRYRVPSLSQIACKTVARTAGPSVSLVLLAFPHHLSLLSSSSVSGSPLPFLK